MAENVPQSVEVPVPLDFFGGLVTEMSPANLPGGVTPDCQDIVFFPGGIASRFGLNGWLDDLLPEGVTVTYEKTFVTPSGKYLNLILDSSGNFYTQDVANPTVITLLDQMAPGSFCNSVSAFGKELLTFHNNVHGTDIPRTYDGEFFDRATQSGPGAPPILSNVTLAGVALHAVGSGNTLSRVANVVTASTFGVGDIKAGMRVQISGVDPAVIGGAITNILVSNAVAPGLATIATATPHGLAPENGVNITGVTPVLINTISSIKRLNGLVTVTMPGFSAAVPDGALIQIAGVTDPTFDGQFIITSNPVTNTFSYLQNDADTTSSGGTIHQAWPLSTLDPLLNIFTVQTVIDPNTFTVAVSTADGTWSDGTITFPWNGTFFVTGAATFTFQYQQYGPNASTTGPGFANPVGQAAPGLHSCVCIFETRMGYVTAPSPPSIPFIASGGKYIGVTDIPIGPPNVIKRIIAFTGADGGNYFYIPVPAVINGVTVSTSTVVENNVDTSAQFDFSDNTLFTGIAIDIPGNNLFALQNIGPCLNVQAYGSRALWSGQKNIIPNLLNLGFEGGHLDLTHPCGWSVMTTGGILDPVRSDFGYGWTITCDGSISKKGMIRQSAFRDSTGTYILEGARRYSLYFRLLATGPLTGNVTMELSSASLGFSSKAIVPVSSLAGIGSFYEAVFDTNTPDEIPSDVLLDLYILGGSAGTIVTVDEMEIYPTLHPYVPVFLVSYVNKPEALDGITGVMGATDDDTPIQTSFIYHDSLLFLTSSGLHETVDSPNFEPYIWKIRAITANCGACGPRACATGENFSVWVSSPSTHPPIGRGLYLYTGGSVYKLSQEIQPDFDSVSPNWQQNAWTCNDPVVRRIYVGLPTFGTETPNLVYVLDYRETDTASELAGKSPIHISMAGKMICSDLSRKWTRWNIASNYGAIMNVPGLGVQMTFCGGNGLYPGVTGGPANSFWLDPNLMTDDYYGMIVPYYTTYFFVGHDLEQSMSLGLHRKLYKRWDSDLSGTGFLKVTPLANSLFNPWPIGPLWPLDPDRAYDIGDGLNVSTERCAFKISTQPRLGETDNAFTLSKFVVTVSQEPVSPIRFGAV